MAEKPETPERPETPQTSGRKECCDKEWRGEGQNFCSMDDFIPETVDLCGMCLYDQQCKGFQQAYETRPEPNYATGAVYCCPDAKRCVDLRVNQGCPSDAVEAECGNYGDAKCGPRMQNDPNYPKSCANVGCNSEFPSAWMEAMSCDNGQEETLGSALLVADAADFNLMDTGLMGFALLGLVSSIYGMIVMVRKFTSSSYETINASEEI